MLFSDWVCYSLSIHFTAPSYGQKVLTHFDSMNQVLSILQFPPSRADVFIDLYFGVYSNEYH